MMTPLFLRHALNALMRWVCRIPEVREVLHTLAIKVTRDPRRSELARARVFNVLAVSSAPEGMVEFAVPVPELPGTSLQLRLDLKDELSRQWYYWGYDRYEPEVRTLMWELVKDLPAGESGDVIDIGANLGYFTLYLGTLLRHRGAGTVQAFEPSPGVFTRLQHNLALNPGLPVKLVPAALSDADGEANLFLADFDSWGHSSASLLPGVVDQDGAVTVRTRALDSFSAESGIGKVSLIKMDCEGAEAAAIRGMKGVLQRDWPHLIMEIIPRFESEILPVLNSLDLARYRKFHVTDEGLVEHEKCFASYENRDWLLSLNPPQRLMKRAAS